MGQVKTITEAVVMETIALAEEIQEALKDNVITLPEAHRIRAQAERVHDAATIADNRIKLVRSAVTAVSNIRTIEDRCARAGFPADDFDLPLEAA